MDRALRVLMLHNDYQHIGGETVSARTEARALTNVGVDVSLVELSNDELANTSPLGTVRRVISHAPSYHLVLDAVRRVSPDIVHAQNLFPLLGAGAIRALEESRTPWVRALRNYRMSCLAGTHYRAGAPCHSCTTARRAVAGVWHGCYRDRASSAIALGYAQRERAEKNSLLAGYIAVSEHVATTLRPALEPGVPVWVKPNTVDDSGFGLGDGGGGLLYVGRLDDYKGIEVVVRIAERLPNHEVHIVGRGDREELVGDASRRLRNLRWTPAISSRTVLEEMAKSSLVLVPSLWEEPFGRVAAEALSVGTPPLVMDRGGLGEIVSSISPSLLLTSEDPSEWATRIEELSTLPRDEMGSLRSRCRARYEETYTPDANARALLEIYEAAL